MIKLEVDREKQTIKVVKIDIKPDVVVRNIIENYKEYIMVFYNSENKIHISIPESYFYVFLSDKETVISEEYFNQILQIFYKIKNLDNIEIVEKKQKTCKDCIHYELFDDITNDSAMFCKLFDGKMNTIEVCNNGFNSKVKRKPIKYTIEYLYHFNCARCNQWFSIGDFEPKKDTTLYCPICGYKHEGLELKYGQK